VIVIGGSEPGSGWYLQSKPNSVALPFTLVYPVFLRREPVYVLWHLVS